MVLSTIECRTGDAAGRAPQLGTVRGADRRGIGSNRECRCERVQFRLRVRLTWPVASQVGVAGRSSRSGRCQVLNGRSRWGKWWRSAGASVQCGGGVRDTRRRECELGRDLLKELKELFGGTPHCGRACCTDERHRHKKQEEEEEKDQEERAPFAAFEVLLHWYSFLQLHQHWVFESSWLESNIGVFVPL